MKLRIIPALCLALGSALLILACGGKGGSAGADKIIRSAQSGGMTISLASDTGAVKVGENDLILLFTDGSGKTIDVGAASLKFHMPGMGSMAPMDDAATLSTTSAPGRYRAHINVEMTGTWEAVVNYQGPKGTGQVTMNVPTK